MGWFALLTVLFYPLSVIALGVAAILAVTAGIVAIPILLDLLLLPLRLVLSVVAGEPVRS